MPELIVHPPVLSAYVSHIPTEILSFNLHLSGLKPRDVMVLLHLLSKPNGWQVCRKAIGNALNLGSWSVNAALKTLQTSGFARYTRFADGHTEWTITLPAFSSETLPTKDHTSATLTPVALDAPTAPPPESKPDDAVLHRIFLRPQDRQVAERILSRLTDSQQKETVLAVFVEAMAKGTIHTPAAYLTVLVSRANAGGLSLPQKAPVVLSQPQKNTDLADRVMAVFKRNKAAILADLASRHFVHLQGMGNFTEHDFKQLGLV